MKLMIEGNNNTLKNRTQFELITMSSTVAIFDSLIMNIKNIREYVLTKKSIAGKSLILKSGLIDAKAENDSCQGKFEDWFIAYKVIDMTVKYLNILI